MPGPLDKGYSPKLVSTAITSLANSPAFGRSSGGMTDYQLAQLELQKSRNALADKRYNDKLAKEAQAQTDALAGLIGGMGAVEGFDVDTTKDVTKQVTKTEELIDSANANAMQKEIDKNPNKYLVTENDYLTDEEKELQAKFDAINNIKDSFEKRKAKYALAKELGYDDNKEDNIAEKAGKGILGTLQKGASYLNDYIIDPVENVFLNEKDSIANIQESLDRGKKELGFYDTDNDPNSFLKKIKKGIQDKIDKKKAKEDSQINLAKKFTKDKEITYNVTKKDVLLDPTEFDKKYNQQMFNLTKRIKDDPNMNTSQKIKALTYALKAAQDKKANYLALRKSLQEERKRQQLRGEKITDAGLTAAAKELAKRKAAQKAGMTQEEAEKLKKLKLGNQKAEKELNGSGGWFSS